MTKSDFRHTGSHHAKEGNGENPAGVSRAEVEGKLQHLRFKRRTIIWAYCLLFVLAISVGIYAKMNGINVYSAHAKFILLLYWCAAATSLYVSLYRVKYDLSINKLLAAEEKRANSAGRDILTIIFWGGCFYGLAFLYFFY